MEKDFPVHLFLDYDQKTGALSVNSKASPELRSRIRFCIKKSSAKSRVDYKIIRLCLNGKQICWMAHRVVWRIFYGEWPNGIIDHVDGDGLNNRIENLRDVTQYQNMKNKRMYKRNRSGITGVRWAPDRAKWEVSIEGRFAARYSDKFEACCHRLSWLSRQPDYTDRHGK